MDELLNAHYTMIKRYRDLIVSSNRGSLNRNYWINFCDTALTVDNSDKLSRWVGFIQGVLYVADLINLEQERDFSRSIYKSIYDSLGMNSETVVVLSER